MATARGSWWLLTINNPSDNDRATLRTPPDVIKQAWYQDEIGEKCGTLHIQLCLNTDNCRFSQIKAMFPTAHIEFAENANACKNYCRKKDTAVPDTYVHYMREGFVPKKGLNPEREVYETNQLLLILASMMEPEMLELDPDDNFNTLLNNMYLLDPVIADKLLSRNVHQAWLRTQNCQFRRFNNLVNSIDDPEDLPPSVRQSCLIEEGCAVCDYSPEGCKECLYEV